MGRGRQTTQATKVSTGSRRQSIYRQPLVLLPYGKQCPLCQTVVSEYSVTRKCECANRLRLKKRGGHYVFRWKLANPPVDYYPQRRAAPITSKERVAICGDTHGHWQVLKDVLLEAGVINADGVRQEGFARVIHIGDLMDGRRAHQDRQTLEFADTIFDEVLIGNHEAAYLGGTAFDGMEQIDPESSRLLNRWEREGKLVVATAVDDWLLTHGGLDPELGIARAGADIAEATEVAAVAGELNEIWRFHRHGDAFGEAFLLLGHERGGSSGYGGVLWNDFRRLIRSESEGRYKQVVGHSPQKEGVVSPEGLIVNVDVGRAGARAAASCLVVDENGSELIFAGRR